MTKTPKKTVKEAMIRKTKRAKLQLPQKQRSQLERLSQLGLPPFLNHEVTNLRWNLLFLFTATDKSNRHSC